MMARKKPQHAGVLRRWCVGWSQNQTLGKHVV